MVRNHGTHRYIGVISLSPFVGRYTIIVVSSWCHFGVNVRNVLTTSLSWCHTYLERPVWHGKHTVQHPYLLCLVVRHMVVLQQLKTERHTMYSLHQQS